MLLKVYCTVMVYFFLKYSISGRMIIFEKVCPKNMSNISGRVVVYPKDVQRLTGKSEKYSRMLLKKIRQCKAKQCHQFISIEDFAEYTGLTVDLVKQHLVD